MAKLLEARGETTRDETAYGDRDTAGGETVAWRKFRAQELSTVKLLPTKLLSVNLPATKLPRTLCDL